MIAPSDEASLAEAICAAYASRAPLAISGNGTLDGMLRPVQAAQFLRMDHCHGITLHSPKELVLAARAGTTLRDIETALAATGQHVIAEPPDYSRLMGTNTMPTIGGIVAANLSGPRRIAAGAMRDHVLGVRAVNGLGEVIASGGRVLKNVTGLDLCKLLAGSHGTLAVLSEITLKILPAPETSASVVLRGLPPAQGVAALAAALGSPFGVSGAAYLPPAAASRLDEDAPIVIARIEEFAESVAYRSERLAALLSAFGVERQIWPAERSRAAWAAIRDADVLPANETDAVWRVSVRPSRGPDVLAVAQQVGADGYLDWGGGLLLLAGPPTETMHAAIMTAAHAAGGVWTLLRGPMGLRSAVPVVPREPPPLAALTRRVKAAMDPAGVLNPGRLLVGI